MRCVQLECSGSSLVFQLRRPRELSNASEVTVRVGFPRRAASKIPCRHQRQSERQRCAAPHDMITSAMPRACKHYRYNMICMQQEPRAFLRDDLVKQEGIRAAAHVKAVAHSEDV